MSKPTVTCIQKINFQADTLYCLMYYYPQLPFWIAKKKVEEDNYAAWLAP
jgi:hypothetical protein